VKIKRGSTSVRRLIFVADSSSTTGAGLANLVFDTASLVGYYFAGDLSNEVSITLATATLGTWASGGFIAVDNTNMPGWYEIGIPDAALDGGNEVAIQLRGAANMVPVNIYIELDAFDYQTATQPVNVTQISGDSTAADNAESFFDGTGYAGTGNVIPTVTTLTNLPTIPANWITAAGLAADAVTEIQSGLATATNVSDAQTAIITQVDAVKAKTDNLPSDPADQSAVEAAITAATSPLATAANLATVQADTDNIQTRLPAALESGRIAAALDSAARVTLAASQPDYAPATAAALTAMRGADNDTLKTLSEQIDGIDGGASLTGPFTRTVTVTDASTSGAIENAKVRLFRTGETGSLQTNLGGVASFTVEAATWSYAITANGYTGTSGTIVVSANGDTAVQLMASSVTPPTDPALSAIEVLCLNANFAAASGIDIDFRMALVATGDQNRAHPGAKKTVTSNGSGIARFEGPQGATIEWKRGSGQQWTAVTLDNDSVTNVTSLIGSP